MGYFRRSPIRFRTILFTGLVLATLILFQAWVNHTMFSGLKGQEPFNWWREAPVPYLNYLLWALLCPLVYTILRRWPFSTRPLFPVVAVHVSLGLVIAASHEVVTSTMYYAILQVLGEFDLRDPFYQQWALRSLPVGVFGRFMEYGVLVGLLVALENARLRRKERMQLLQVRNALQATQLNALRKQLQPHFLFNTLNTVSALMDDDTGAARKVLSRLGQLLRTTLDEDRQEIVTLDQELDYVGNYLGIEAERFRDRLRVRYEVPGELLGAKVPGMILQPLVENAIKHGPDARHGAVEIVLRAEQGDQRLHLFVSDNGKGCSDVMRVMELVMNGHAAGAPSPAGAVQDGQMHIGLRNVRERLNLLYGPRCGFRIASPGGRGFEVELTLPLERK